MQLPLALVALLFLCAAPYSVLCQQQRFRIRPSNVSVVEGDSAILRCEVQHQVGQLQWAKDGFALGYSRWLPGYDRYRMQGDPGSGVHNLEIANVTLEDDGRFQCQVSPNRGQAAIRADAFLTVLGKPRSVVISTAARTLRTRHYEIAAGSQLTLKCDVIGARPAAQVQWQRNGVPLSSGQEDTFSDWGSPRRTDTTSVVTLRPSAGDDGAGYSCVAKHPAIRPDDEGKLNATVRLSVLHRPEAPLISGYREGEWVRIGEPKTLTCISRGGNPPAKIVWFKNGQPITFQYRTLSDQARAQLSFSVKRDDSNATYRCEATSDLQPSPMTAIVRMRVQFGPERVTVSGTKEARGGDTVHMSCITSSSNPPSNITWVVNGRTMTNTSQAQQSASAGGWITRSNLSIAIPPGMQEDMLVLCHALNPRLSVTKQGFSTIAVLRPPKPPSIRGYEPGTHLRYGERVSLSCVSQGGNPPATLTWYRGDTKLPSTTEVQDKVARSVITFQVDHTDNGRVYRCQSQNSATSSVQSVDIALDVHFAPSSLKLDVGPDRLRSGSQAILTCESRPSYPAAQLTWWRDNTQINDGVTAMETFPAGDNGGISSRLQLRKNLTWTDHMAVYQCRSQTDGMVAPLQEQLRLDVAYLPTFPNITYTEDIEEGASRQINITARGNPDDIAYRWYRVSATGDTTVVSEDPALNMSRVNRTSGGLYYLEATNSVGNTTVSVNINVLYAPEIVSVSRVVLVSPGAVGVLKCSALASPSPPDLITWHRANFNFSSSRISRHHSADGTSYLTVHNVTREDSGEFQCLARNKVGHISAVTGLLVRQPVEMVKDVRHSKAAARLGHTARVTCRATGAPNVTFQWSDAGSTIQPKATDGKHQLLHSRVDLVTWQSILKIKNVQTSDYATYECVATNELGSQRQQIVLGRPSSPDPPLDLKVVNVSHDAVTLNWQPGFDGGEEQKYRLRYKATIGGEYVYKSVQPPNSTSFTVTGLLPSTQYTFDVMAYNQLGNSVFSNAATTPILLRDGDTAELAVFDEGRLPWIVIVVVSSVGGLLLLINVVLVVFFIRRRLRRAKRTMSESASASEASTKSETLHMYGETVSSVSVKSGASYSREDSVEDFHEGVGGSRYEPCLRDGLLKPPSEYGGQVRSASRADYQPADQYAEALRRNSYACTIGVGVEPMGSTLNSAYTTQPPRAPQFRSPQFSAPTPDLIHSSGSGPVCDSVPQLHSLQAAYYPETRQYSTLPHQRQAQVKPLASFGRLASPPPPAIPEAPLEQRGHLV